jgi:hypothetical protein
MFYQSFPREYLGEYFIGRVLLKGEFLEPLTKSETDTFDITGPETSGSDSTITTPIMGANTSETTA